MSLQPIVSVVIPLFNHEQYINEAVISVLNQGLDQVEIVIIDDGSQDRSRRVVEEIGDHRIRLFAQHNRGAHHALNRGIYLAKGAYISFLNSDDVYAPDRLVQCLNLMEADSRVDATITDVEAIGAAGEHLYFFQDALSRQNKGQRSHQDQIIALDLLRDNFALTTSNLFCRREVFDGLEGFRPIRYCHDLDLFLRLSHGNHVRLIEKPLLKYRFHGANTIKENAAKVIFEVAVVLADYLVTYDLDSYYPDAELSFKMADVLQALQYKYFFPIDKIVSVLLHLLPTESESRRRAVTKLFTDEYDPFRLACLEYLHSALEHEELCNFLLQENERLSCKVKVLKDENILYKKSFSRRIGRAITWPARIFMQHTKQKP